MEPLNANNNSDTTNFDKHAKGAILGAFIGDSVGSYDEFGMRELEEEEIDATIKMPGGGYHDLSPG